METLSRRFAAMSVLMIALSSALVMLCAGRIALVGSFSSYQTIFGMIAERYAAHHFRNIAYPELFMIEWGKPALELIFFPLSSLCAAALKVFFGGTMDFWGRFVSVAATSVNVWLIYRIARCGFSRGAGACAAFFFAFAPFVWVYGRNFQNEALALLFLSLGLFGIMRLRRNASRQAWFLVSALAVGVAGMLRIHFLFLIPALVCFFPERSRVWEKAGWLALSLLPSVLWNLHDLRAENLYPNIHSTLFMQLRVGKTFPHPYLLRPMYYLRLLWNLAGWTAGPLGFIFAAWAMLRVVKGKALQNWSFLLASAWAVAVLIPQKFAAQHFYAYASVLPMSVLAGAGLAQTGKWKLLPVSLLLSLAVAYGTAYKVSASDLAVFPAARFIRQTVPEGDWVIASHGTSGDLLYYAGRLGWSFAVTPHENRPLSVYMDIATRGGPSRDKIEQRNAAYRNSVDWLEYLREQGAKWFIVSQHKALEANPALLEYLKAHYKLISGPSDAFDAYRL